MHARSGELYQHKDIGDTFLVIDQFTSDGLSFVRCINLNKSAPCSINEVFWKVFYRPLAHTQESK